MSVSRQGAPPRVSIIVPAWRAAATVTAAVASALGQTLRDLEVLVNSDDCRDYRAIIGSDDPRLVFLATGEDGAGPGAARNLGLAASRGEFIATLDADDLFYPTRIERLLPLAARFGAATDDPLSVEHATGRPLGSAFAGRCGYLSPDDVMALDRPIFPLYRRSLVGRWQTDIRFAEDVLFNLAAIIRAGGLALHPEPLMEYRVREDSLSHGADSQRRAEQAYCTILAALRDGASDYGFAPRWREPLIAMFQRKQALNRACAAAIERGLCRNFSEFVLLAHRPGSGC